MANTDTAQFVITGVFDPTAMLSGINSAFKKAETTMNSRLNNMSANANKQFGKVFSASGAGAANNAMAQLGKGSKNASTHTKAVQASLGEIKADLFVAAKRVLLWGAASRLVFQTFNQISSALKDIIQLNQILVNIQKIRPAGLPTGIIEGNIIESAKQFGVAFEEIGETQRTFFQQGFKVNEVIKLTEAQLLGVTAAGLSTSESIELLIGSMSIFNIQAERSLSLIDKLQAVQASYAVSTVDLATAIKRVGPVVEQIGGDIDNLIGVITALKESTRKSGEFIGTALSTIFSRAITPVGAKALRAIGVNINKTAQELRPLRDILNDLALAWEGLTDQEKISTAFALGARRRYAQVIALMNNYSTAVEAGATSMNAFGAAIIAQQKEVQSIARQFAIARESIRATGIEIVRALLGSEDTGKSLANLGRRVQELSALARKSADTWAYWIKVIGKGAVFLTAGTAAYFLAKRLNLMVASVAQASIAMATFRGQSEATAASLARISTIAVRFGKVFQLAAGALGIIGAAVGIASLVKSMNSAAKANEDYEKSFVGLEKESTKVKNILKDMLPIVKKFQDVQGPQALTDFLGKGIQGKDSGIVAYLRGIEGVANDLSNVTMEQFREALTAVRGEASKLEDGIEDLSNVIGFFEVTQKGLATELEKFKSGIEVTGQGMAELITLGNLLRDTETGGATFLDRLLGQTPEEFAAGLQTALNSGLGTFAKLPKSLGEAGIDGQAITDAVYQDLIKRENPMIKAFAEGGVPGEKALRELSEAIYKVFSRAVISGGETVVTVPAAQFRDPETEVKPFISVQPETDYNENYLRSIINQIVSDFASVERVQKDLKELETQGDFDIYKIIAGVGTDPQTQANVDKLLNFLAVEAPGAIRGFKDDINPLNVALKLLQNQLKASSEGLAYFPTKVHSAVASLATFTSRTYELGLGLDTAALKSDAFGKSLLTLQLSATSKRITEGLEKLAQAGNFDKRIKSVTILRTHYQSLINKYAEMEKTEAGRARLDKEGIYVQDLIKKADALGVEYENLVVAKSQVAGSARLINKELNENITNFNKLVTTIVGINTGYKAATTSIKTYGQASKKVNQELLKFEQAQSKIIKQFDLLGAKNDYAKRLGADVAEITRNYEAQRKAIDSQEKGLKASFARQESALKTKQQELKAENERNSALADQADLVKGINRKEIEALANQKILTEGKLKALDYDRERLDLAEQNAKRLAIQNTYLAIAKKSQQELNQLASGYASATADIVTNINEIVSERGSVRTILQPYADAYVESLTARLSSSLEQVFQGIAGKTIGQKIDEAEAAVKALQSKQTAQTSGDIIKFSMIEGGQIAGDYIKQSMSQGAGTGSGVGSVPTGTTAAVEGGQTATGSVLGPIGAPIVMSVENQTEILQAQGIKDAQQRADQLKMQAKIEVGIQSMGAIIGGIIAGGNPNAQLGANLGGAAGSIFGPIGSVVGSIGGALIGGLFGSDEEDKDLPTPKIYEANTDALRTNTEAILKNSQDFSFMAKLLNSPSNFILPSPALLGGGLPQVVVNVNSPVGSAQALGDTVYDAVSRAYSDNGRRVGRHG